MERVRELIEKAGAEGQFLSIGGDTYIVMFLPYLPNEPQKGEIFIDNYYPCYLRIRALKRTLHDYLVDNGYSIAGNGYLYKRLALMTGRATLLRNTLAAHAEFGSFFAIEVLRVSGEHGGAAPVAEADNETCKQCAICAAACPTACIEGGFERSRCVRELQNEGYMEDENAASLFGNRVWGCNTCQLVCPVNRKIKRAAFVLPEALSAQKLFFSALKGKIGLTEYKNILGENYIRPVRLLTLAINAMTNSGDKSCYEQIKALSGHSEQKIRKASIRYLERVKL